MISDSRELRFEHRPKRVNECLHYRCNRLRKLEFGISQGMHRSGDLHQYERNVTLALCPELLVPTKEGLRMFTVWSDSPLDMCAWVDRGLRQIVLNNRHANWMSAERPL
jgi:hypothetical protein